MNIWVNGCFDILHTGHIDLLKFAKTYDGNKNQLIVGIDSNERVKMLKGDSRPINDQFTRAKMLGAIKWVDSVVIFNNDDEMRHFITKFEIDYLIIGDQYKDKLIIGAECAKFGVIYYPTDERSSTNIIEKIKKEIRLEVFYEIHNEFHRKNDKISMGINNYVVSKIGELIK